MSVPGKKAFVNIDRMDTVSPANPFPPMIACEYTGGMSAANPKRLDCNRAVATPSRNTQAKRIPTRVLIEETMAGRSGTNARMAKAATKGISVFTDTERKRDASTRTHTVSKKVC